MKKLILATVALAFMAPAAFAGTNSDDDKKMRHQFMMETQKMIETQMAEIKKMNEMLSTYEKQLKMMMDNEARGDN